MSMLCLSCRMFENKINELEKELTKKTSSVSELKRQLKETSEREEEAQISIRRLQDQVIKADKGVGFLSSSTESENTFRLKELCFWS